jgi:hypothetical protein
MTYDFEEQPCFEGLDDWCSRRGLWFEGEELGWKTKADVVSYLRANKRKKFHFVGPKRMKEILLWAGLKPPLPENNMTERIRVFKLLKNHLRRGLSHPHNFAVMHVKC